MNSFLKIIRVPVTILLVLSGAAALHIFLHSISPFGGYDLLVEEFETGFWYFLRDNFPAISWDAGTWGPGLGAFVLALLIAHRFLSKWAAATGRHWSFMTSLCLALVLPALFVIAFIVPGLLLQWELLRQTPWIEIR